MDMENGVQGSGMGSGKPTVLDSEVLIMKL